MPRSNKKKKNSPIGSPIPGCPSPSPFGKTPSFLSDEIPSFFLNGGPSLMVQRAIASAARQGLELMPGRANPALGNCAFEAPIFNLNDRSCFNENLPMAIGYYRRIWILDMENRLFNSPWNPGYSQIEWHTGWEQLKEDNVYEIDFFGDLVLPAIACGLKKNLLIFNTNINHPRTPISVIFPSEYGVEANSRFPIILAYDMSHYENLHPADANDAEKSVELVNSLKDNNYNLTHEDLKTLVCLESPVDIRAKNQFNKSRIANMKYNMSEVTGTKDEIDQIKRLTENPKLPTKRKIKDDKNENPKKRKVLNVRGMTDDERKQYRREQYRGKVLQLNAENGKKIKQKRAGEKQSERLKKKKENEPLFKENLAAEKSSQREKKRQENEPQFKHQRANEKQLERDKKR